MPEPLAAHLHFLPRLIKPVQAAMIRVLRRYFEGASGWTLLTTRGRKTGLPRETLMPCVKTADMLLMISTYGRRSDWIKNLSKDPRVSVTVAGGIVAGTAEVVQDVERKRQLVTAHPFFPVAPFALLNALLKPLLPLFLRRWVTPRPVVVVRYGKSSEE